MFALRLFLVSFLIALSVYTAVVIANHGWDLYTVFFGDIVRMGWPGQFNFDFMGFLTLSALWVAWRNRFSALGIALAVIALLGGMMFLTVYLLILSTNARSVRDLVTQPEPN